MREIKNKISKKNYFKCDFSAKLFKADTLYEKRLGDRKWVVFSPDFPGFPVVMEEDVHTILNSFRNGAPVSLMLSENDFDRAFSSISFLEEKGFLRGERVSLPYEPLWDIEKRPSTFGVWLHINNNCNLGCEYCFVGKKSGEVMNDKVMEEVVESLAYTAISRNIKKFELKFAGGEPTLTISRIEKFYNMLHERLTGTGIEFWTAVLSNGTILNERLLKFLKNPNTGIGISLDGYGIVHDRYRVFKGTKNGSWDTIQRNLEILKKNDISPYIMATISQETCNGLEQLLRWIFKKGYRTRISIVRQPSRCWDCGDIRMDKEYETMCVELQDAFEKALAGIEESDFDIDLRHAMEIGELHIENPSFDASCSIGVSHVVIKPDGSMVPCPMMVNQEGIKPSRDLLKSCKECFPYKPSERRERAEEDDCLNCKWFPVCVGGCTVANLEANGHPYTKSRLCSFFKYLIPRYISFFGNKLMQAARKNA